MNIKVENIGQMTDTEVMFRKVKENMNPVFRAMLSDIRFAVETRNLYFDPFTFALPHGRGAGATSAILLSVLYAIEKDVEAKCKAVKMALQRVGVLKRGSDYHTAKTQNRCIKGHVVCVSKTIRQSMTMMKHMQWAIGKLGIQDRYGKNLVEMYLERNGNGPRIYFMTLDRFKDFKGQFKYIIFPDVDMLTTEEYHKCKTKALSSLQEELNTFCFVDYKVPMGITHWTYNQFTIKPSKGKTYHRYFGTYKTMPKEYLGEFFYREADILKTSNPEDYENEFLGKVTIKNRKGANRNGK